MVRSKLDLPDTGTAEQLHFSPRWLNIHKFRCNVERLAYEVNGPRTESGNRKPKTSPDDEDLISRPIGTCRR